MWGLLALAPQTWGSGIPRVPGPPPPSMSDVSAPPCGGGAGRLKITMFTRRGMLAAPQPATASPACPASARGGGGPPGNRGSSFQPAMCPGPGPALPGTPEAGGRPGAEVPTPGPPPGSPALVDVLRRPREAGCVAPGRPRASGDRTPERQEQTIANDDGDKVVCESDFSWCQAAPTCQGSDLGQAGVLPDELSLSSKTWSGGGTEASQWVTPGSGRAQTRTPSLAHLREGEGWQEPGLRGPRGLPGGVGVGAGALKDE